MLEFFDSEEKNSKKIACRDLRFGRREVGMTKKTGKSQAQKRITTPPKRTSTGRANVCICVCMLVYSEEKEGEARGQPTTAAPSPSHDAGHLLAQ